MNEEPPAELTRSELLTIYANSLDEYRFQVNLNWARTQYDLAFNLALTGAGTGIVQAAQAREHKAQIEARLSLGDLSLRTTPGMGSAIRRFGRVTAS